jgi:hypothetical protein
MLFEPWMSYGPVSICLTTALPCRGEFHLRWNFQFLPDLYFIQEREYDFLNESAPKAAIASQPAALRATPTFERNGSRNWRSIVASSGGSEINIAPSSAG